MSTQVGQSAPTPSIRGFHGDRLGQLFIEQKLRLLVVDQQCGQGAKSNLPEVCVTSGRGTGRSPVTGEDSVKSFSHGMQCARRPSLNDLCGVWPKAINYSNNSHEKSRAKNNLRAQGQGLPRVTPGTLSIPGRQVDTISRLSKEKNQSAE